MVEKREREFLLLEMAHRRSDRDFVGGPCIKDELGGFYVGEIEEFEEPIDHVDLLRIAVDIDAHRRAERKNIVGPHAKNALPQEL